MRKFFLWAIFLLVFSGVFAEESGGEKKMVLRFGHMAIELPSLPYARDALEPYISRETIDYHYGKHHQAYVNKLNELITGTEFQNKSLEEIMLSCGPGAIFNNAGQAWNHILYWNSLKPGGGSQPNKELAAAIDLAFGSYTLFCEAFTKAALGLFGSGWVWLVADAQHKLAIVTTANANNPLVDSGRKVLLACDVWEHAYYIDTRNDRASYVKNFLSLANWDYAASRF